MNDTSTISTGRMRPVVSMTPEEAASVRFVMTDIDDTLTREGRVPEAAYSALWRLHDAGFSVIPVTGRPAGWCDLIARHWPVEAVVGENGAFVLYMEEGKLQEFYHPSVNPEAMKNAFDVMKEAVFSQVPGTRESKDQFARKFDLAIDFREEPPFLEFEDAEKIKEICESFGAQAKISSIHVNTWFGEYNKLSMTKLFFSQRYGIDLDTDNNVVCFCGDSPNDEPMFEFFNLSCGVANFKPMQHLVTYPPRFICSMDDADGFAELADILCRYKAEREQ
jgi:1,2-diacylglycerol 3-alpha-glucosyltransferase